MTSSRPRNRLHQVAFSSLIIGFLFVGFNLIALVIESVAPQFPGPHPPVRPPPTMVFDPGFSIRHLDQVTIANSEGYADRLYANPRPEGVVRVLAIGDSMTFGFGTPPGSAFVDQAERLLNERNPARPIEIVNLGAPGYDSYEEYYVLLHYGERLAPDMVLLNYFANDMMILRMHPDAYLLTPKQVIRRGRLNAWLVRTFPLYRVGHDGLFMALTGATPDGLGHPHYARDDNPGVAYSFYYIELMIDWCKKHNVQLMVTLVPWISLDIKPGWPNPEAAVTEFLTKKFGRYGLEPLDLFPALAGYEGAALRLEDTHPNELAHRLFAEYLVPHLANALD